MILDAIFARDGCYLVSAADDKTIRVGDMETGATVRAIRGQSGRARGEDLCRGPVAG